MATKITKIGIIQIASLPGDFPNNLRAVVNGYRECLEHGAQLVVAPASAVCGLEPHSLARRDSFLAQTQDCLEKISKELGEVPMLLAAHSRNFQDEDLYAGVVCEGDDNYEPWLEQDMVVELTPYLLDCDGVTELEANSTIDINEQLVYVDLDDGEILPDDECDLIVRLPHAPWHTSQAKEDAEMRSWEASMSATPVICCRPVGTADGNIYGGGSTVHSSAGDLILRLPFFEAAAEVVNLKRPKPVLALPEPAEILCSAIERGIRDTVKNNCYSGVCVPLDAPHSALLGVICVEALGASNVAGISFKGNKELADKLGITCYEPATGNLLDSAASLFDDDQSAALTERIETAIAMSYAESRALLLCSTLTRREIMLGDFACYGRSGGHLVPLGNLYDVDLFLMSERLAEKYSDIFGALSAPPAGNTDRIIHELVDRNKAAGELLHPEKNYMFKENDVRLTQRRIVASAMKRTQLPIILQAGSQDQQHSFPTVHRLND